MKTLKTIVIVVAVIIATLLIAALFINKNYSVEREIIINKPKQEVFDYIKFLKNQNNFSKWASMDPSMKTEFRGTDGTAGFVSAWESEARHVGKGEQEILNIKEGKRIDYEIRFTEPMSSVSPAYMITDSISANQTLVIWGFGGKMNYPMNIMLVFMNMDKVIGSDFEIGLGNLKDILENQ
jgi:hypothetical protein